MVEPDGLAPPAVAEEDVDVFADPVELDPEPVEADGLPEADEPVDLEAVEEDAPAVVLVADVLLPEVDEDENEEGEEGLLVPEDACGLDASDLPSVEAEPPDFGTLALEADDVPLPAFASTFSAFRSIVTGRLDVPEEEDALLLSGLSDDPGPFPPEEEFPPEDFLSVAI